MYEAFLNSQDEIADDLGSRQTTSLVWGSASVAGTSNAKSNGEPLMPVARRDWLLLLLALRDAGEPLDPVRLQAGMFLLSHESELRLYEFEALDSGPFSPHVEADIGELEEHRLVLRQMVAGVTWHEFSATDSGLKHAEALVDHMTGVELDALRRLAAIKQGVLSLGFRDLMDHLRQQYPTFTRRSVFG